MIVEDEVKKIKSFNFTNDGKSIVMSNKSRISNAIDKNTAIEHSIVTVREELDDTKRRHDKRLSDVEQHVKTLELSYDVDDPLAYEG